MTCDVVQVALAHVSGQSDFTVTPSLAAVAAAASSAVDNLLTHMQRSLVQLSIPSLNLFPPESCTPASLMRECHAAAAAAKQSIAAVFQRCEDDVASIISLLQVLKCLDYNRRPLVI